MSDLNKIRKVPPLPFQGNKANGRKKFLEFLFKIVDGDNMTFVDLFGGSFYLSYLVHKVFPNAKIICNDYDNYLERLKNINITNELLNKIREILVNSEKMKKVDDNIKQRIDVLLKDQNGYVDWVTLSASLLYSSKYTTNKEEFLERCYWNKICKKPYNEDISDYIEGIEFVHKDWSELFEEYAEKEDVIFIADPPYYKTSNFGYVGKEWTLRDLLNTLEILKTAMFAYYTSNKSGLIEILDFMIDQGVEFNNFERFVYKRRNISKDLYENTELILYRFDEYVDEEEEEESNE